MGFGTIITLIYLVCYSYVRLWSWRLLRGGASIKFPVILIMDVLSVLVVTIQFLRDRLPENIENYLLTFRYSWASIIASLVPIALILEPAYQLLKKYKPNFIEMYGARIFAYMAGITLILIIGGAINARFPKIKDLKIEVPAADKKNKGKEIVIAACSDLHAGNIVNSKWIENVADKINSISPDAVLFLGDTLNDKFEEGNGALKALSNIKAPLGKYAVLGNHEYYIDTYWSIKNLKKSGFNILEDEAVVLSNSLVLAGRRDTTVQRVGGVRLPLKKILSDMPSHPVILMDHNPSDLQEAQDSKVSLQLSGHTHNGQLFPFNFLIGMLYEESYGEHQKGDTRYYVSCGVGVWGTPIRTSSVPEILRIKVKFN